MTVNSRRYSAMLPVATALTRNNLFDPLPVGTPRRAFGKALVGLMLLSVAAVPPVFGQAETQFVRITIKHTNLREADSTVLRIVREQPGPVLDIPVVLRGDALQSADYRFSGAGVVAETKGLLRIRIPRGQSQIELNLHIAEDPDAEPAETVLFEIRDGPGYTVRPGAGRAGVVVAANGLAVTTTNDSGPGSLRQAIVEANQRPGPDTIRFSSRDGPFALPQTIRLSSPLPTLVGELVIDGYIRDRLWKPAGVTVTAGGQFRILHIAPGARVTLRALTIAEGGANTGAGVINHGTLTIDSATFRDNVAEDSGGALANYGATIQIVNSTFARNVAGERGGGVASLKGKLILTNSTFTDNQATKGGALFNAGTLLVRNTILANSTPAEDCVSLGQLDPTSTHNLIESDYGCGEPLTRADPVLRKLGGYNGSTHTIPLGARSPAINMGNNAAAVGPDGARLVWDQRGNGDPRFVSGITDIGAFETQIVISLQVDRTDDSDVRGCTKALTGDCSLRGAITLMNAMEHFRQPITFDPRIFRGGATLSLERPLPRIGKPLVIDATAISGVTIKTSKELIPLSCRPGVSISLRNVAIPNVSSPEGCVLR